MTIQSKCSSIELSPAVTLVQECLNAKVELIQLINKETAIIRRLRANISRLKSRYWEKITALEEERAGKQNGMEMRAQEKLDKIKAQMKDMSESEKKARRILSFLALDRKADLHFKDGNLSTGRKRKDYLGQLIASHSINIKLYWVENGNSVNCFSLVAAGKCLFNSDMLGITLPYEYSTPMWPRVLNDGLNILTVLRTSANIATLATYCEKNEDKLLFELRSRCEKAEKELEMIRKKYRVEDFMELIEFRCKACGYFMTKTDHQQIATTSQNPTLCPKCNKKLPLN